MTPNNSWEYSERFYPFEDHLLVEGRSISKDIWDEWQPKIFELIRSDVDSGWQIDQGNWGPHLIRYKTKRINMLTRSLGYWIVYILVSVATFGFGLFIAPFFMYKDFMQFEGVKIKLMRKQN